MGSYPLFEWVLIPNRKCFDLLKDSGTMMMHQRDIFIDIDIIRTMSFQKNAFLVTKHDLIKHGTLLGGLFYGS